MEKHCLANAYAFGKSLFMPKNNLGFLTNKHINSVCIKNG